MNIKSENTWHKALQSRVYRMQITTVLIALTVLALAIPQFFQFIELRKGHPLEDDVILSLLTPSDLSLYIFILIYSGIIFTLLFVAKYPQVVLKGLLAYCIMVLMRLLTMYLLPLNPDKEIIPLHDPFVGNLFYNNLIITKDLFFSGHIATLFLLVLLIPGKNLKLLMLLVTITVAAMLLIQHAHYTIDIIAAPVFTWISYVIADKMLKTHTSENGPD